LSKHERHMEYDFLRFHQEYQSFFYISAFPDLREFKRHMDNIAWETEVWIEANPAHMIQFNGPKFLTVYE